MEIVPAVNQVETHVFNQQTEPQKEFGTRIMSWRPLTEGRNGFFTNSILAEIGSKYGKKHSTDRSALVNPTWRHHHPQTRFT